MQIDWYKDDFVDLDSIDWVIVLNQIVLTLLINSS